MKKETNATPDKAFKKPKTLDRVFDYYVRLGPSRIIRCARAAAVKQLKAEHDALEEVAQIAVEITLDAHNVETAQARYGDASSFIPMLAKRKVKLAKALTNLAAIRAGKAVRS